MKKQLDEVKRLQKIAGILKEGFADPEGASIDFTDRGAIDRLDSIAKEHPGFMPVNTAVKKPLVAVWKNVVGYVALYRDPQLGLRVKWEDINGNSDPAGDDVLEWSNPEKWEEHFPTTDDSGDEL